MIDIENKVIDTVTAAFVTAQKNITVSSEFVERPSKFPYCFIQQTSNVALQKTFDERPTENHVTVRFRIEIYSNRKGLARTEVKRLMQIADGAMQNMKFTRTSYNFLPNYDASVVRARADYYAIVGRPQTINNKTVYQMYR